jgi:hypothetical protein
VALVFMIARERRMHAGLRRQIRCRRCNRLGWSDSRRRR